MSGGVDWQPIRVKIDVSRAGVMRMDLFRLEVLLVFGLRIVIMNVPIGNQCPHLPLLQW